MNEICRNLKPQIAKFITSSSKIYISGHHEPDFDAIAAAIGVLELCKHFKKEAYIVLDEKGIELEPGVKKIIRNNQERFHIISKEEFDASFDENSSLIVVDTSKNFLTEVADHMGRFKKVAVIDHHEPGKDFIKADVSCIDTSISSASEIVASVLLAQGVKTDSDVANYLLAGIQLDTNRYRKNTTSHTHEVAKKLIDRGANADFVNQLFMAEFEADKRIHNLVYNNGNTLLVDYHPSLFEPKRVSYTFNREKPDTIYRKEELAKAADRMLKYDVDASFAIGLVREDLISISARSKTGIDVGKIMGELGGGGSINSAATKIVGNDILAVASELETAVSNSLEDSKDSSKVYLLKPCQDK